MKNSKIVDFFYFWSYRSPKKINLKNTNSFTSIGQQHFQVLLNLETKRKNLFPALNGLKTRVAMVCFINRCQWPGLTGTSWRIASSCWPTVCWRTCQQRSNGCWWPSCVGRPWPTHCGWCG